MLLGHVQWSLSYLGAVSHCALVQYLYSAEFVQDVIVTSVTVLFCYE